LALTIDWLCLSQNRRETQWPKTQAHCVSDALSGGWTRPVNELVVQPGPFACARLHSRLLVVARIIKGDGERIARFGDSDVVDVERVRIESVEKYANFGAGERSAVDGIFPRAPCEGFARL